MSKQHVGRLPANTGEPGQFFHRGRNLAAKFLHELARATLQRFRLGVEKPERTNVFFYLPRWRPRKCSRVGVTAEQFRRNFIDRFVSALGGENHRDKQLESIAMNQRALEAGVAWRQARSDSSGARVFFLK